MSSRYDAKLRYALGLFVRVQELEGAVRELRGTRLPLDQVKLIVPPEQSASDRAWGACGSRLGIATWVASAASGPYRWTFAPVAVAHESASDGLVKFETCPDFHIWDLKRHADQLDKHLRGGGAIAVVRVRTDAEERAVSLTFLRHARAGVQIHEISRHD